MDLFRSEESAFGCCDKGGVDGRAMGIIGRVEVVAHLGSDVKPSGASMRCSGLGVILPRLKNCTAAVLEWPSRASTYANYIQETLLRGTMYSSNEGGIIEKASQPTAVRISAAQYRTRSILSQSTPHGSNPQINDPRSPPQRDPYTIPAPRTWRW